MRCASCVPRFGWIVALAIGFCMAGGPIVAADAGVAAERRATAHGQRAAEPDAPEQRRSARTITRPAPRDGVADNQPIGSRVRAGGSWLGSLLSLAAVVAMIFLGAKLWKKHGPLARTALPTEALDVLGRRALDPRQAIYLVRLGSRILVLGSTGAGLSTLAEIGDPVEVDVLAGLCRPPADGHAEKARGFAALFDRHLWGVRPSSPHPDVASRAGPSSDVPHTDFERLRRGEEANA